MNLKPSTQKNLYEHNDQFIPSNNGRLKTLTNNSGGTQGGISNGEPIILRVGFKPTATIRKEQQTIDSDNASGRFRILVPFRLFFMIPFNCFHKLKVFLKIF